jgi:hypothetical protein
METEGGEWRVGAWEGGYGGYGGRWEGGDVQELM